MSCPLLHQVTSECMSKWSGHQARLNELGNFLTEVTSPQTSRAMADEMRKVNMHWADFVKRTTFVRVGVSFVTYNYLYCILQLLTSDMCCI